MYASKYLDASLARNDSLNTQERNSFLSNQVKVLRTSLLLCACSALPQLSLPPATHISFRLTFHVLHRGWFLPVEEPAMLERSERAGREGIHPHSEGGTWLAHPGCRKGVTRVIKADPALFKYQIPPPESLGSAPGFEPLLLTCLCKAAQGLSFCCLPFYAAATTRCRIIPTSFHVFKGLAKC